LSESEKKLLTKSLDDLVKETPAVDVAVMRVEKFLPKAGAIVAASFKEIMISIVTEGVKRKLWG
jgi:hypothetical protein